MTQQWQEIKGVEHVVLTGNRILIIGFPEDANDEKHNCDQMGCASSCVLFRGVLSEKKIGVTTQEFKP